MNYSWQKGLLYGLGIWVVMFVIVSIFVGFKVYDNQVSKVIIIILSGVVTYFFVRYAKPKDLTVGLWYGLSWVVVGMALDFLVTIRFSPNIFKSKSLWAGYVVVFLVAWFGQKLLKSQTPAPPAQNL